MDDDDLLGGPAIGGGGDDLLGGDDDFLGGPAVNPDAMAFDDDLLGGGGSAGANAAAAPAAASAAISMKRALKLSPVSEAATQLLPFLNKDTYFARFVQVVDADGNRARRVLLATSDRILVKREDDTLEREFPVWAVIGILEQAMIVSKFMSKEEELHVLLMVDEVPDLLFALSKDPGNGENVPMRALPDALTAICAAYDIDLAVATLKPSENINDFVKKVNIDFRVRQQMTEILADRTELYKEVHTLSKKESSLEVEVAQIKASKEGQAVADIVKETTQFDMLIESYKKKNEEVDGLRRKAEAMRQQLIEELAAEKARRDEHVANNVSEANKQRMMQQVAEYEVKKGNHKRQMDRTQKITSVYERRVRDRKEESYGVSLIGMRIDDLEKQLRDIQQLAVKPGEDHAKRIAALAENRRRFATCEDLLKSLPEEIKLLELTPFDQPLPAVVESIDLPPIKPEVPHVDGAAPEEKPTEKHADPAPAAAPAPATASITPPPAAAEKKPVVISDDDDI